jgi:UDP:flavonoid glycosyltransferase YjiC (YdhE family)
MLYNFGMRILIAPLIHTPKADAAYYLTGNLVSLFAQEDHPCAVCTSSHSRFHSVSFFPAAPYQTSRLFAAHADRSYDAWLYRSGAGSSAFLEADIAAIHSAIKQFKPDLIITIDRTAAVIAAREAGIRCWAVVHNSMYNSRPTKKAVQSLNAVLSSHNAEQVLNFGELYSYCERRFCFGPIEIQPFPVEADVTRIGIQSLYPLHTLQTNRICIFLGEVKQKPNTLSKIITDAFLGAPYAVYTWFPGIHPETQGNLHFLSTPREDLLPGSIAIIHDGNDYLFNQSMVRGIPQLLIYSRDCLRITNALAAERSGIGIGIDENDLTMSTLYENYRVLLSNDRYYERNQAIADQCNADLDLSEIIKYL